MTIDFKLKNERLVNKLKKQGIHSKRLLKAISKSPRHLFIPEEHHNIAYDNKPIPIGFNATISQPYTVALMLQELEIKKRDKILEIGAGSGWGASLLSILVGKEGHVFTLEIIPELVDFAVSNLQKIDIKNVEVIKTDGSKGHKEESPYDKIIITAACPKVPKVLLKQLKLNGILVAPIGPLYNQKMLKIIKRQNKLEIKDLGNFIFVPMQGEYGFRNNNFEEKQITE